jgi:hypothetical protein
MKLLFCIGALLIIFAHGFTAAADLRTGSKRATSVWMLAGAVIAAAGIILCLTGSPADWIVCLAGFACIAVSAIRNGVEDEAFHLRHHLIRILLFLLITAGVWFL